MARKRTARDYERLVIFVPKGRRNEIQKTADACDVTLDEFVNEAIDEQIGSLQPLNLDRPWFFADDPRVAVEAM